jgi:hypothetical protein
MNTESFMAEFLTDRKTYKVGVYSCCCGREKHECGISQPNSNLYQLSIVGDSEVLIPVNKQYVTSRRKWFRVKQIDFKICIQH